MQVPPGFLVWFSQNSTRTQERSTRFRTRQAVHRLLPKSWIITCQGLEKVHVLGCNLLLSCRSGYLAAPFIFLRLFFMHPTARFLQLLWSPDTVYLTEKNAVTRWFFVSKAGASVIFTLEINARFLGTSDRRIGWFPYYSQCIDRYQHVLSKFWGIACDRQI